MYRANASVIPAVALPLPLKAGRRSIHMQMFKRSQLYVAFALAALAEIIIRAAVR